MKQRKKGRILTRISRMVDKWLDLKQELEEQRFPVNTPVMKDLAKIKIYLVSLVDHLDTSIQMRDDSIKFSLEEEYADE